MKKALFYIAVAMMALTPLLSGCNSSPEDEPDPVEEPKDPIDPDPQPPVEDVPSEYSIDPKAVENYFSAAIKGDDSSYEASGSLTEEQIKGASEYVWKLWKAAVGRNSAERLPSLSPHNELRSWGDVVTADATWQLPEGSMSVFYGSKGSKPSSGYPLMLFIHGSGSDANYEWTVSLAWAQYFKDGNVAYFVPRSPQGGTGCRWYQPSRQQKWEQMLRQALVADNIDPNKIYFMGISEGAYGSQRLASFYADYLAGAGPIAGGELLANCPPENLANTSFILQTGDEDTAYGRRLLTMKVGKVLDELQASHPGYYDHKVDLQPGKGHGCNYEVTTPWLVQKTRNVNPKYVYWENYGLGGINNEPVRYRDSFYNLHILELSNDRKDEMNRAVYEMNISDDNVIDLTVRNVKLTTCEPASGEFWTMNIGVDKAYSPAAEGKVRIYLNSELVDPSKPVVVKVNGSEQFNGKIAADTRHLIESAALFYDPARLYPYAVEVSIK